MHNGRSSTEIEIICRSFYPQTDAFMGFIDFIVSFSLHWSQRMCLEWYLAMLFVGHSSLLAIIDNNYLQLEKATYCVKHCWGVYEQNSIVNNVCVDDWTAESVIIASNAKWNELKEKEWHLLLFYNRWKNTADLVTRWFKLLVTETRLFHRKLPPSVLTDSSCLFYL